MIRYTHPYQIRTKKSDYILAQKYCEENGLMLSEELRRIVESMANKQRIKEEVKNEIN